MGYGGESQVNGWMMLVAVVRRTQCVVDGHKNDGTRVDWIVKLLGPRQRMGEEPSPAFPSTASLVARGLVAWGI